jgi:membrane protease YdiL (CAAX protease family)
VAAPATPGDLSAPAWRRCAVLGAGTLVLLAASTTSALPWLRGAPLDALALIVLFPFAEEVLFRGALQGWLLRHEALRFRQGPLSGANLCTSLGFACAHVPAQGPEWALAVFVPSLFLGILRERSGSLRWPICAHVAMNLAWFLHRPPAL